MSNIKADTYCREMAAQIIRNNPWIGITEEKLYSMLYDAFTAGKNYAEFYMEKS